jgi:hypothetical protein
MMCVGVLLSDETAQIQTIQMSSLPYRTAPTPNNHQKFQEMTDGTVFRIFLQNKKRIWNLHVSNLRKYK